MNNIFWDGGSTNVNRFHLGYKFWQKKCREHKIFLMTTGEYVNAKDCHIKPHSLIWSHVGNFAAEIKIDVPFGIRQRPKLPSPPFPSAHLIKKNFCHYSLFMQLICGNFQSAQFPSFSFWHFLTSYIRHVFSVGVEEASHQGFPHNDTWICARTRTAWTEDPGWDLPVIHAWAGTTWIEYQGWELRSTIVLYEELICRRVVLYVLRNNSSPWFVNKIFIGHPSVKQIRKYVLSNHSLSSSNA
jgi:hypothetical protein